ncbi:MAG: hypothetical protein AAF590_09490 [Pseudomonadota bacterium]
MFGHLNWVGTFGGPYSDNLHDFCRIKVRIKRFDALDHHYFGEPTAHTSNPNGMRIAPHGKKKEA